MIFYKKRTELTELEQKKKDYERTIIAKMNEIRNFLNLDIIFSDYLSGASRVCGMVSQINEWRHNLEEVEQKIKEL